MIFGRGRNDPRASAASNYSSRGRHDQPALAALPVVNSHSTHLQPTDLVSRKVKQGHRPPARSMQSPRIEHPRHPLALLARFMGVAHEQIVRLLLEQSLHALSYIAMCDRNPPPTQIDYFAMAKADSPVYFHRAFQGLLIEVVIPKDVVTRQQSAGCDDLGTGEVTTMNQSLGALVGEQLHARSGALDVVMGV
jgi:hypothetical protein